MSQQPPPPPPPSDTWPPSPPVDQWSPPPPPFGGGPPAPRRGRGPRAAALVAVLVVVAAGAYVGVAAGVHLPPFQSSKAPTAAAPSSSALPSYTLFPTATPKAPGSQKASTPTPAPTAQPTASGQSTPASSASIDEALNDMDGVGDGQLGDTGDTTLNPDTSFACGYDVLTDQGDVFAYLTVAGSDQSDTDDLCSWVEDDSEYQSENSLPLTSSDVAECWTATGDGGATARLYVDQDYAGDATGLTDELCSAMLDGVTT